MYKKALRESLPLAHSYGLLASLLLLLSFLLSWLVMAFDGTPGERFADLPGLIQGASMLLGVGALVLLGTAFLLDLHKHLLSALREAFQSEYPEIYGRWLPPGKRDLLALGWAHDRSNPEALEIFRVLLGDNQHQSQTARDVLRAAQQLTVQGGV